MGEAKIASADGVTDGREAKVRALYYVMRSLEVGPVQHVGLSDT